MIAILQAPRKAIGQAFAILSILWLAACQTGLPVGGGGQQINPNEAVPVALLVPHGAANSGEAALARDLEKAARLAVADLAGVKIDLRVYGTAGNPAKATEAALTAVSDGAKIIIGPLHAEAANAAALAVAPKDVNVLAFTNNATVAGGNLFVLGNTFDNSANRLMQYARKNGKSNVMMVSSRNLAGQIGEEAITKAAAANGMTIAGRVTYEFSQEGVVAAVPTITRASREKNADTLFLTANAAGALPLLAQMLPEAGLTPENIQYVGLSRWDTPPQTLGLPGVQGGWFTIPDTGRATVFKQRFEAAHGTAPHSLAGLAYDGVAAVGALVKSGNRNALTRGALTQSSGFQGTGGAFRFLPDGTNQRALSVATIRGNQVVVLDPAPQRFRGGGF